MNIRRIPRWLSITAVVMAFAGSAVGMERNDMLAFKPGARGEYTFDTGVLRGELRQDGRSRGLSAVVHIPSGARLDGSVGIAGHYRVFTTNKRYGTAAWDWPSTDELQSDGGVRTTWPAAEDRPFKMTALYRWADPQTLDVETTVTAKADLTDFESFFASYFDKAFPTPYVQVAEPTGDERSTLLPGRKDFGDWLMFIRNGDERGRIIKDGRWLLEPHPVDWTILPRLNAPLCLRRGEGHKLAVIVMAPRQDCFAVAMPYAGESHYSLYLSLFGRDLKASESARAHTRFIVAENLSDGDVNYLYGQYIAQLRHAK